MAGVREDMAHVPQAELTGDVRARCPAAPGGSQLGRHLADASGTPGCDVDGAACRRRLEQGDRVGARHVADVDEVAELGAVLEDGRCPPVSEGAEEDAGDTGVRGLAWHPGSIDVVVPKGDIADARFAGEDLAEPLLGELGGRIDAARVDGRFLRHRVRPEAFAAARAAGLEAAGLEILPPPRQRSHRAMTRAGVTTLSVDDHARGEHQRAGEAAPLQSGEERRGPQVV